LFDDRRALIAAGKLQRWEVVKWAVTANFALGAVSAGIQKGLHGLFFVFSVGIAIIAIVLLWHYNSRMTRVRGSLGSINAFLRDNVIDINKVGNADFVRTKGSEYDREEMLMFYGASVLLILPRLLSWAATW
jgi:hypothetical protein